MRVGANRRGVVRLNRKEAAKEILLGLVGQDVPFPEYADDPIGFVRNVLSIRNLTEKQRQILESVRDERVTNVPAGFGVGKTFIAAMITLWWVFARGGYVVTTAPTERQVKKLLWREIRKHYDSHRAKLGGSRATMSLRLSETAQAFGFSARDSDEESAAGFHDPYLLAIVDEANGISQSMDNAVTGWTSGHTNRLLRIGNPTKDGTPFAKSCAGQGAIRISCFDHPNTEWAYRNEKMRPEIARGIMTVGENGLPVVKPRDQWTGAAREFIDDAIPGAVSVEWIEATRYSLDRGEGTSYWEGRVLGLFPSDAGTSILPRSWFQAARRRYDADPLRWDRIAAGEMWRHGLDIGDGIDDHARASRKGPVLYEIEVVPTRGDRRDQSRAVALVYATNDGSADRDAKPGVWNIDRLGVGAGVLSFVLTANDELEPGASGYVEAREVNFGDNKRRLSSSDRRSYVNVRAKAYWTLRTMAEEGELAIAPLPPDVEQRLQEELANTKWEHDIQGRVKIMKKELIKDAIGRSPDVADAVAMAFLDTGIGQSEPVKY